MSPERRVVEIRDFRDRLIEVPAQLSDDHKKYLQARGVNSDLALDAGIRSASDVQLRALQGRRRFAGFGFVIPYDDGDYWVCRLEVPTDGRKFIYPPNAPTRPYLPAVIDPRLWADPSYDLVLCEGPIKALSLSLAGIPAIGLAGATGGGHDAQLRREQGVTHLHPVLQQRVRWAGRRAYVMLDNDRHTNATVRAGECIVAEALMTAGAVPFAAAVPVLPGHDKLGADDFLVLKGVDAVVDHLSASAPWRPEKRPHRGFGWTLTRQKEVLLFLDHFFPAGHRLPSRLLYELYRAWCRSSGVPPVTETMLMRHLKLMPNMKKVRLHGRSHWIRGS